MKVMSMSKQFIAIKVEPNNPNFFLEVGKKLNDKYYEIKQIKGDVYCSPHKSLVLKIDDHEVEVREGHYILVDMIDDNIKYVTEEMYKNDYVELK